MNTLKEKVVSGIFWNGIARIGQQVVQFVFSIFLARLLAPENFGIIGIISVFTSFVGLLSNTGFVSAIVQKPELDEQQLSSVFWFNLLIGLGLNLFMFSCAPWIAGFYAIPILENATKLLSFTFIISPISMVSLALLQRHMNFARLANITLVTTLSAGILGVFLAFNGFGIWSLVFQSLAQTSITTLLIFLTSDWKPRFEFRWGTIKNLLNYSANLTGFNFINYWARNADNLLIGRFLGAAQLGFYSRAYGLMLLPISQIISLISDVMVSSLSKIQNNPAQVRNLFLRTLSIVSLLSFPIMTGIMVTAEPFILTIYGSQWRSVIPSLQILAIVGLIQTIINPLGWIYTSQGRTDLLFRQFGIYWSIAMVTSIVIGIVLGSIETVALSYAIANFLLVYPAIRLAGKLVDISFANVLRSVQGALTASFLMAALVLFVDKSITSTWLSEQRLAILVIIGMSSYIVLVWVFRIAGVEEMLSLLRAKLLNPIKRKLQHQPLP